MGLQEELLAIDEERYETLRKDIAEKWGTLWEDPKLADAQTIVNKYPALARETRLAELNAAIINGDGWEAYRESLLGALTLIQYAETAE